MADEEVSNDGRKPQAPVIDLEAKPVDDEPARPVDNATPAPQAKRAGQWRLWGAVAIAAAAAVLGAWFFRGYGASWFPTDAMVSLEEKVGAVESSTKTLGEQIKGLGADVDKLKTDSAATLAAARDATGIAKTAGATATEAAASVAALGERLTKAEGALTDAQSTLAELRSALAGGGPVTTAPVDTARLDDLAQRVDELEKAVAALKAGGSGTPDTETARLLSQTLSDLKSKLATGAPYTDELARLKQLVPAAPGLAELEASAASGLATPAGLTDELAFLVSTLPGTEPEAPPSEQSTWDWFTSLFGGIVTIRDLGETNWRDVAAKAHGYAEAGDLKQAIAIVAAAEGEMPVGLSNWLVAARARVEGDAAAEALSAAVLRQIAALGGTP